MRPEEQEIGLRRDIEKEVGLLVPTGATRVAVFLSRGQAQLVLDLLRAEWDRRQAELKVSQG